VQQPTHVIFYCVPQLLAEFVARIRRQDGDSFDNHRSLVWFATFQTSLH